MKNLIFVIALLLGSAALADHHEGDKKAEKKVATKGHVNCDKMKTDAEKKMCNEKMNSSKHDDMHGDMHGETDEAKKDK